MWVATTGKCRAWAVSEGQCKTADMPRHACTTLEVSNAVQGNPANRA